MLSEMEQTATVEKIDGASIDAAKLRVTWTLLQARRKDPELFEKGSYQALDVEGERSQHLFAFARVLDDRALIVVVPRWSARLKGGALEWPLGETTWGDTALAVPSHRTYRDAFTGREFEFDGDPESRKLRASEVLTTFPIAALFSTL